MVPDWILGGKRSITAQYMIPALLAVQLAITYLLGKNLTNSSLRFWQQKFWQLLLVILMTEGILSCAVSTQATVWYNKDLNGENAAIAKFVNQATHPLLISDTTVGNLLSLSHSLKPTVQILLQPRCATCPIQPSSQFRAYLPEVKELERFSDVFLYYYDVRKEWLQELVKQSNYNFEPIVFGAAE